MEPIDKSREIYRIVIELKSQSKSSESLISLVLRQVYEEFVTSTKIDAMAETTLLCYVVRNKRVYSVAYLISHYDRYLELSFGFHELYKKAQARSFASSVEVQKIIGEIICEVYYWNTMIQRATQREKRGDKEMEEEEEEEEEE